MKENIENNSKSTQKRIRLKDLMNGPVLKPFSISIGIMIFQQTSGVSAIIFNTVSIFRKAGSNLDSHYATIIVGFVQLVFTVASGFFVKWLMYFFKFFHIFIAIKLDLIIGRSFRKKDSLARIKLFLCHISSCIGVLLSLPKIVGWRRSYRPIRMVTSTIFDRFLYCLFWWDVERSIHYHGRDVS